MNILKNVTDYLISGDFSMDVHAEVRHTCKATQNSPFFFLYLTLGQADFFGLCFISSF